MMLMKDELEGVAYPQGDDATLTIVDVDGQVLWGRAMTEPQKLEALQELVPPYGGVELFGCVVNKPPERRRMVPNRYDPEVRVSTGANQEFRPMTPERRMEEMMRMTENAVRKARSIEARAEQQRKAFEAKQETERERQKREAEEEQSDPVIEEVGDGKPEKGPEKPQEEAS